MDGGFVEREDSVAAEVVEDEGEDLRALVRDGDTLGCRFGKGGAGDVGMEEDSSEHVWTVVLEHG